VNAVAPPPFAEPAPVALFAFKRPVHLQRTVESLAANPLATRTHVVVFCDAARDERDTDGVAAVRAKVAQMRGFASVTPVHRESNLGLARSIIDGVSQLLAAHGRVIVVEDDLLLSPHFLLYMNEGLEVYAGDDKVASLHGYCYPVDMPLPETFFLRGADCWGWATWSRAWSHFEPDGRALLAALEAQGLTRRFDLDGSFPYTRMLADQIAGRNDSWAVRWHAACFLRGMLTLYPGRTLVENIGNDASGTHRGATGDFSASVSSTPVPVRRIALDESALARRAFARFHQRRGSLVGRALGALQRAIG
jgi:hypothetical protein